MLDRAMQEFADAMQAKARVRRPRPAATRRADELDNLSAPGRAAAIGNDPRLLERRRLFQRRDGDRLVHRYRRETGVRRQVKSEERTAAGRASFVRSIRYRQAHRRREGAIPVALMWTVC